MFEIGLRWLNDPIKTFLVATFVLPLLFWLLYWVFLRVFDWQRLAEFPRVLFRPLIPFLFSCLLLASFSQIGIGLRPVVGSGPIQDYAALLLLSLVRIAAG